MALAGIARHFHDITGFTYRAGIWKEMWLPHLCWISVSPESAQCSRVAEIPSWSWTSINGIVDLKHKGFYRDSRQDKKFRLIDVATALLYPAREFGQIKGGRLRVHGLLGRMPFRRHHTPIEDENDAPEHSRRGMRTYGTSKNGIFRHWDSLKARRLASEADEVRYLLMIRNACTAILHGALGSFGSANMSMILIPWTSNSKAMRQDRNELPRTFRRVGVFEMSKPLTAEIFGWIRDPEEIVII